MEDPALSLVAVASLALGIGANVAIFSIINAVLLRPLPFPEPERIVHVMERSTTGARSGARRVTGRLFADWRDRTLTLEHIAGYTDSSHTLMAPSGPVGLQGARVSPSLFAILGVTPSLGRLLDRDDERQGNSRVALLSAGIWERVFGRDPTIVGAIVSLDGEPVEVVGVLPLSFRFPNSEVEVWTPLVLTPERLQRFLSVARLRPGVTIAQAEAEAAVVIASLNPNRPGQTEQPRFRVELSTLKDATVGDSRARLLILWLALGCVLGVACVNVATLLLIRGFSRQRELALRSALGAHPLRLFWQSAMDGVLLGVLGGLVGIALGIGLQRVTLSIAPQAIPRAESVNVDFTVIGFAVLLSLAVGIVASMVPAVSSSRADATPLLRESSEQVTNRTWTAPGWAWCQGALAALQVAIASTLLINVLLLGGGLLRLVEDDLGYEPEDVLTAQLTFRVPPSHESISEMARYFRGTFRDVVDRVSRIEGVEHAGLVSFLPLTYGVSLPFEITGRTVVEETEAVSTARFQLVTPGYFHAMGIRVVQGSLPAPGDILPDRSVVVNETFARMFLDDTAAVGSELELSFAGDASFEVAVVVEDTVAQGFDGGVEPEIYFSYFSGSDAPFFSRVPYIVIKTRQDAVDVVDRLRASVHELDPTVPLDEVATMDSRLATTMARPRLVVFLVGVFAAITFGVAFAGLYGVLSYQVARRRREIGIRMALGGTPMAALRPVMTYVAVVVLAGIMCGLLGGFASQGLFARFLVVTEPPAVLVYLLATVLVAVVSLATCYGIARQALRAEATEAMRT